ncbi:MAG: ArsR family transcriptional regulator [Deltaproteobacteria bacterium]|nr:MAG: ArsR family transcriptional regulator [Deltaproteobacteria bacterium]
MRRYSITIGTMLCLTLFVLNYSCASSKSTNMDKVERVSPKEARENTKAGKALLVCAYDDSTCKDMVLDGSLLRSEFESKLSSLSRNQEIIFYCA